MPDSLKRAQESLNIQSVNIKQSKIFVRDDADFSLLNRTELITQTFRSFDKIREISLLSTEKKAVWDYRFIYSAGIRLIFIEEEEKSSEDSYEPLIEIAAAFEAKYLSEKQLTESELKAFSVDNVGYHVWPYWREYVQASCARIGFSPAFEVPFYRIAQTPE